MGWLQRSLFLLIILGSAACTAPPDPAAARLRADQAQRLFDQGQYGAGLEQLRLAVDLDPADLGIRHQLAQRYLMGHQRAEAWEELTKILAVYGRPVLHTRPQDDYAAGCAALLLGQVAWADRLLADATIRHPYSVPLLQARAIALYRKKEFDAAVGLLLRALDSTVADAHPEAQGDFPDRIEPSFLRMLLRESFRKSLQDPDGDPADVADLARKAIGWFDTWGLPHAALARALDRSGDTPGARESYQAALALAPHDLGVVRAARRFYVLRSDYAGAYGVWSRAVPLATLRARDNVFADRLRVLEATSQTALNTKPKTLIDLARAYDKMGWTEAALIVTRRAMETLKTSNEAKTLHERLTAHQDFVERIQGFLRTVYFKSLQGHAMPGAEAILAFVEGAGMRSGAIRFDPKAELVSTFLAGQEVFPTNHPDSRLTAYFASHGQFFSVTESWGFPVVKLMNILYAAETTHPPPGDAQARARPYSWYIGDEARIVSLAGFLSNDPRIAGLTCISASGFVVDAEALRPGRSEYDPARAGDLSEEATPAVRAAARLHQQELSALAGTDEENLQELFEAVFAAKIDKVARHEFGHVVDLRKHFPILAHLPSNLWLVFSHGLSSERIRARGEMVAEAASLADARRPHMVVRDSILWLHAEQDLPYWYRLARAQSDWAETSPYRQAGNELYSRILARATAALRSTGQFDEHMEPVEQIHRLTADQLRRIGAAICREQGLD